MKKLFLSISMFLFAFTVNAQWNMDTLVRNVITNTAGNQSNPQICSDGNEGAIICWTDLGSSPARIYAQHIDSAGYTTWASNGVLIHNVSAIINGSEPPAIASDGNGGAIIAYTVLSGGLNCIYAMRINELGQQVWSQPAVIDVAGDAHNPQIRRDNFGGAILNWYRNVGSYTQIFVQWVDSSGSTFLNPNGMQITFGNIFHLDSKIDNGGNHKAYIIYNDDDTLRMQYFDTSGVVLWPAPVLLTTTYATAIPNYDLVHANGYELAFWTDNRTFTQPGVYGQRVTSAGIKDWNPAGKVIDTSNVSHANLDICRDGQNGAFICFGENNIAVQRINGNGNTKFSFAISQCSGGGISQTKPKIIFDDIGGAIISWQDSRGDKGVYAQNIDSTGNVLWRLCGSPVYNNFNNGAENNLVVVSRHDQKAIAAFTNNGSGANDVVAALVYNIPEVTGVYENNLSKGMIVSPNPADNSTTINFNGLLNQTDINIYNSTGQLVFTTSSDQNSVLISTETWISGLYLVIADNGKSVMSTRLIIE